MAIGSLAGVIPRLRATALALPGATSDAELLDRFVTARDAAAFEALVRRHGPMVLAVCRRILRNTHDAEDAFQATFLVLAYKAASVSPRNRLAAWLHGVAQKTALKARHRAARRTEVEKRVPARSAEDMTPELTRADAEPLLDQELAALPELYRLPIVLCDLEGQLRSAVAVTLGCSEGTLSSRLTRGRRMLAERLKRRGVSLSSAAIVVILTERQVALAESLVRATVPVALAPMSAAVSPNVAQLATGVLKSMFLKKLQTVTVAAVVTLGATFALTGLVADPTHAAAPVPKTPAGPVLDEKALNEALADVDGQLLLNRKVLKDIKCDIDQLDRIMDAVEAGTLASRKKTQEAMVQIKVNANGGNVNPEAINQMFKDAQEAGEKEMRKATAEVVTKMLTLPQRARLREIDLQSRGHDVFTTASVAKALDLSPKQKEQFAANVQQTADEVQQAFQKPVQVGLGNFAAVSSFDVDSITKEARAEGMKRALAILTDEQKESWKKLTGEPIKYTINRPWMGASTGVVRANAGGVMVAPRVVGVALPAPALPAVPALPAPVPANPPK